VGGTGSNQYYHIPAFSALQLDFPKAAFISGSNPQCDTGNGATACIMGTFVNFITTGTVGPGTGNGNPTAVIGVQLIR
jgi:hypothetical protein